MRNVVPPKIRRLLNPLFWDQVASSGSNVLLILVAARSLSIEDFAVFATIQLINTSLMGIGRLAVYGPALSAQRTGGRLRIPAKWIAWVCVGLTVASSPLVAWILATGSQLSASEIGLICIAPAVVFAQDGFRYVRMSESRIGVVLASDLVWLVTTVPLVAVVGDTVSRAFLAWIAGAFLGFIILIPQPASTRSAVKFSSAWSMGRWGLIDSLLASFIIAGPTVAAGFLNQSLVPVYRVIQSAMSPMNLMNSVLVVSFGLGAWQFSRPDAAGLLLARVRKATAVLMALAVALSTIGVGAALLFAEIGFEDAWGPWLIVAGSTIVGGWMSARQAASQSLGMQHIGAATRLFSALFAGAVILSAMSILDLKDPIGLTVAGTAIIGLIGSQIGFRRGIARLMAHRGAG